MVIGRTNLAEMSLVICTMLALGWEKNIAEVDDSLILDGALTQCYLVCHLLSIFWRLL